MDNLNNLYSVIKSFLPIADKYLINSPLEPYLPQIESIINTIDSFGGIEKINSLLSGLNINKQQFIDNNNNSNISKVNTTNNYVNKNIKKIDEYTKI